MWDDTGAEEEVRADWRSGRQRRDEGIEREMAERQQGARKVGRRRRGPMKRQPTGFFFKEKLIKK